MWDLRAGRTHRERSFCALCLLLFPQVGYTQIFGFNLIANGDAESSGSARQSPGDIPSWTKNGNVSVLAYSSATGINLAAGDLAPANHGTSYFAGGVNSPSTLSQTIDISPGASLIDQGKITCLLSGYIGSSTTANGPYQSGAYVYIDFQDGSGKVLLSISVGASRGVKTGLLYDPALALVPPTARSAVVTLRFSGVGGPQDGGFADNLSLTLNVPQAAASVLGRNLISNGDAEAGPPSGANAMAPDVPGWQRYRMSVASYKDPNAAAPKLDGATGHGQNFFVGSLSDVAISQSFQTFDVSAAATAIDTGQVTFTLSGWLGGISARDTTSIDLYCNGWIVPDSSAGKRCATLSSGSHGANEMLYEAQTDAIPRGTRVITLSLNFTPAAGTLAAPFGLADDLSLVLSSNGSISSAPAIFRVQPASGFGDGSGPIAAGTWIEIYGTNLAASTRSWAASDFSGPNPHAGIDGTSVTLNSMGLAVSYISPTQVNAYIPLAAVDGSLGLEDLVVGSPTGYSGAYTVGVLGNGASPGLLAPTSFLIHGAQYAVALHLDGTFVLPMNAIAGVTSSPAMPGETIVLYGIGFGQVDPNNTSDAIVSQPANLRTPVQALFGGKTGGVLFAGLSAGSIGLYQFNVVVPEIPDSDTVDLTFTTGGVRVPQTLFTTVRHPSK